MTATRDLRHIRKVTIDWPRSGASYDLDEVVRMKKLEELYIGVNEVVMVASVFGSRNHYRRWQSPKSPTPQQQLTLLRHPGMSTLLSIKGLKKVVFVKLHNEQTGGPIPGGFLETIVRPKLLAPAPRKHKKTRSTSTFRFLELPPEIRNRVYGLVLAVDRPVHPSPLRPSSAPKRKDACVDTTQEFALSLLQVDKQVHDEAFALFYHCNTFEFYYPTQLIAFILSLNAQRQKSVRNITLHYHNHSSGGIEIMDLAVSLLKHVSGLRRLHIIGRGYLWRNEAAVFSSRHSRITVRDFEVEDEVKSMKEKDPNLNYQPGSQGAFFSSLEKIIAHFNTALVEAQGGNVNEMILNDDQWHMKEPFPALKTSQVD